MEERSSSPNGLFLILERDRVPRRWSWLCPELLLFPDSAAARRAWREANAEPMRRIRHWVIWAAFIAASVVIGILLPHCGASRIAVYMTVAIWNLIPTVVILLLVRRRIRRSLRRALNELGVAVCLRCGYELRGLSEPRCPECGGPFEAS